MFLVKIKDEVEGTVLVQLSSTRQKAEQFVSTVSGGDETEIVELEVDAKEMTEID